MRTSAMNSFILTILMISCCFQTMAAETTQPNRSIAMAADAFLKAVLAGDPTAVAATLREDAVEMPPCRPLLKGRPAIEQYYRELFQGPFKITAFTFSHVETASTGDLGYATGTYEQKLSGPAGSINDTGKFVVIVKRASGVWKAAYSIYNSDHLPSGACAATAAGMPVRFPDRDLAALLNAYTDLASRWLIRLGLLALGAAFLTLAVMLIRALRRRRISRVTGYDLKRLDRLHNTRRNSLRAIEVSARAGNHA